MKRIGLIVAASLALPFTAQAQSDIGVGVAHSDGAGDTTIFLPITLDNNGLWVEPFLSYADTESTSGGTTTETENWTLGAGLFQDIHTTQKTKAYIGGRLGYFESETTTSGGGSTEGDGWLIAPTLGFGYLPVENLMVGAEADITYTDSDTDTASGGSADSESTNTNTRIFVRYFFN